MKPSIGASMESTPLSGLIAGNGKKSTSSLAVVSCWPTKEPRRYIPDFFWSRLVAASCHVAPRAALASVCSGRISAQVLKTSLTFCVLPRLLAGHQVDMELIAVDAHVDDVEGAHRRPAVLVGERDRGEAVLLHLGTEGLELVEGRGDLVALLLPHARAVEDCPRVVVQRHEVLLAVVARRRRLEGVGELAADLRPDVRDVAGQALRGEEPHPVPGEPGEDVIRLALEIGVDVLLERVVVDGVDRPLHAAVGSERRNGVGKRLLGDGV